MNLPSQSVEALKLCRVETSGPASLTPDASRSNREPILAGPARRLIRRFLAFSILLVLAPKALWAYCDSSKESYPIFQCSGLAYFNPPPDFNPNKYFLDPNSPSAGLQNITAVFWQIGFGNNTANPGAGSSGIGISGKNSFTGNDQGSWSVDLLEASSATLEPGIPLGALCLGTNNWANPGVDGCPDNPRDPALSHTDDDLLNPYFDLYYSSTGYPGHYSLAWQQDYPMAVLLTESSGFYFAIAAVASMGAATTAAARTARALSLRATIPGPVTREPDTSTSPTSRTACPTWRCRS
jgi:hypothetical protein